MYRCPVCTQTLCNTSYYITEHGKVCEDCYESSENTESDYDYFKEKISEQRI